MQSNTEFNILSRFAFSCVCCICILIILMKACHAFILFLSIKKTGQVFGWYKMVHGGLNHRNTLPTVR